MTSRLAQKTSPLPLSPCSAEKSSPLRLFREILANFLPVLKSASFKSIAPRRETSISFSDRYAPGPAPPDRADFSRTNEEKRSARRLDDACDAPDEALAAADDRIRANDAKENNAIVMASAESIEKYA